MAEITDPTTAKPVEPSPWDPTCPGCRSGFGPVPEPEDPIIKIVDPYATVEG